ncbi:MAG: hypothetical protein ETSY1_30080 [Candidatus Entotheonella factor]|uniref:Uncharacterized protein n=1 Tax=Entotheonella factor TaxID=1429438 RepID=W4LCW4_ENTF1|nr:MAG: hypothetical protein ETSY1_30080 [Candidatus Entotheonella factor]
MLPGLQSTLITGVLGLIIALGLGYLWKSEQAKNARLQGELSQALANAETLKAALEEQQATLETLTQLVGTNQEQIDAVIEERDAARVETQQARSQIDALRAAEPSRALAAPFDRGNAAHQRFSDSLRRISNANSGARPGGDNTDAAGTGDSP